MINIEIVQELENRVKKVIGLIRGLRIENSTLKTRISDLESELANLNLSNSTQQNNEEQLEAGLNGVLDILSEFDADTDGNQNPENRVTGDSTEITEETPEENLETTTMEQSHADEIPDNDMQKKETVSQESPSLGDWQSISNTESDSEDSDWVNSLDDDSEVEDSPASNESENEELDIF